MEAIPQSDPRGEKDTRDIIPSLRISSLESTGQGGITCLMLHTLGEKGKIPLCLQL